MKQRMRDGYSGSFSDYVTHYDEVGLEHYTKIAENLVAGIDVRGKKVLDVGCGTGILSLIILEKGASKLICTDISASMLNQCRAKIAAKGYSSEMVEYHEVDAERLPLSDNSIDVVVSNMVLGMIPNQQRLVSEITRVLRPGGIIALSTHAPEQYREAVEASLKVMNLPYFMGYRFEYWPRDEAGIKDIFINAGLDNINTKRLTWVDYFRNGNEAFDFFASTTALWWYDRLPKDKREKETVRTRNYYQRKGVTSITIDVVLAYGTKKYIT
jgi:ubiquinone/menaquinone biosynthesis C-methylase UbiE